VRVRAKLGISVAVAGGLAVALGAAMPVPATAAPAASSAMTSPVSTHHVSPFGLGAHRAAHHVRRHAVAPALATGTTRWVSNTVPAGTAPGTSCTRPGYATISGALSAAAPGDTIKVCAGTYPEQLAISSPVSLVAHGAVTVQGPSSPSSPLPACDNDGGSQPNQDVVDICGPVTVSMTGFTIRGGWPSNVCYGSIYGVAVLGGASLNMSNSTVENIGGDPQTDGCQGGVGIQVGLANDASSGTNSADTGTAALTNVVVKTYQKNGITIDGTGSSATITGATVTGTGETPAIAQNGIQVSDLATATITGSTVSGDECDDTPGGCGPNGVTDVQSAGILLFDAGKTSVSSTSVSASDIGVYDLQDFGWQFFAPPPSFTAAPELFFGMALNNRYENAFFDEGKAALDSSTLSGGEVGVELEQGSYQITPDLAIAKTDTISGATQNSVLVASDQTAGDKKVKLTATGDSFDNAVTNQSTSVLGLTRDWWGDASGPSVWGFGTGVAVSADVNFFPWATDSGLSTFQTCATGLTETTTGNDVVLCAKGGTANAFLANDGSGSVLLIGNKGNDQLNGSGTGATWIIGGVGGSNVINGNNGTGFIQERGNAGDTLINAGGYPVAAR
jgi:hypothetical protein